MIMPVATAMTPELQKFLLEDNTDKNERMPWYTCGHYARDLARNASLHNISIGSIILSNNICFRGYNNCIMNYIIYEDNLILIDPQSDQIYALNSGLKCYDQPCIYYRLYQDGIMVPSFWQVNFAPTGMIMEEMIL